MRIHVAIAFFATAGVLAYLGAQNSRQEQKLSLPPSPLKSIPAPTTSQPLRFTLPCLDEVKIQSIARELEFLSSPDSHPEDDVELLGSAFRQYHKAFGQHPVGTNEEIIAALAGRNRKSVALISPTHADIDGKGRLLDRWGTPYFFHQHSGSEMEVISAGFDRVLFSRDDVRSMRAQ
ncbi:MAG: hypothetical protein ACI9R3_000562 [Verrucomicrobiales bacterium]|jgi:hypothetical protein